MKHTGSAAKSIIIYYVRCQSWQKDLFTVLKIEDK